MWNWSADHVMWRKEVNVQLGKSCVTVNSPAKRKVHLSLLCSPFQKDCDVTSRFRNQPLLVSSRYFHLFDLFIFPLWRISSKMYNTVLVLHLQNIWKNPACGLSADFQRNIPSSHWHCLRLSLHGPFSQRLLMLAALYLNHTSNRWENVHMESNRILQPLWLLEQLLATHWSGRHKYVQKIKQREGGGVRSISRVEIDMKLAQRQCRFLITMRPTFMQPFPKL